MGYLMMCALSAWAGRSGRCVLPFLSPRGTLSTWCVERAVAAATRQGVPRARLRDRVVALLRVVMRPSEPVANERAGRRRTHAAAWTPRRRPRGKLNARWIVDTCQGRTKTRPEWRRKIRPSGRPVARLKVAVRVG